VLLQEFGENLVLALELFLQGSDLAILGVVLGFAAMAGILEGSRAVLEELLLPEVEEVDGEVVFLADVGDRLLLQEVEAKQSDLLFRSEVTALANHVSSSARVFPLTPPKANSSSD
jgi:hypothetical protein